MTRARQSPELRRLHRTRKEATKVLAANLINDISQLADMEDALLEVTLRSYMQRKKDTKRRRAGGMKRRFRQRKSWAHFQYRLTGRQFRRYFRMSRVCFEYLCAKIEANVGVENFKSEEYLREIKAGIHGVRARANFFGAHESSTGGFISGEVKLALTLRLLAGGSYLDLALLFEAVQSTVYYAFHDVIKNWILDDRLVKINGLDYVSDDIRMERVALEFLVGSNGLMAGCIGALDGWIVKIKRPTKTKDRVLNPPSFFSRKGYFAVNVQVIVDKKKRILFRDISSRGAEHDSTAFKNSPLYKWCLNNWEHLREKGFYFIGDSAYSLMSFMLTPFDGVEHKTQGDNFNFFHSQQRIIVECTFGEIDLRWGILWRKLGFTLKHNTQIIDACLRLHNFIIDYREETGADDGPERSVFDEDSRRYHAAQTDIGGDVGGVFGGDDEEKRDANGNKLVGGRPLKREQQSRAVGTSDRKKLRQEIFRRRWVRPPSNYFKQNNRVHLNDA